MAKITYIPWSDSITDTVKIEEIFQKSDAKYILRRAFDGYSSCDQCNGDLAETDRWFSIATDDPADIRRFFDPDGHNGWDVWDDYFSGGDLYDELHDDILTFANYLDDEDKKRIVDTIIANGCNLDLRRETVEDRHWLDELTYTDDGGDVYTFCCPSCAEAYQAAHPDVQLHKVG